MLNNINLQLENKAENFTYLQGVPINMVIEWWLEYRLWFPIIDKWHTDIEHGKSSVDF